MFSKLIKIIQLCLTVRIRNKTIHTISLDDQTNRDDALFKKQPVNNEQRIHLYICIYFFLNKRNLFLFYPPLDTYISLPLEIFSQPSVKVPLTGIVYLDQDFYETSPLRQRHRKRLEFSTDLSTATFE